MNRNSMKQTALTHVHQALGAKMVPFAGFNMPVSYQGVNQEHQCVREAVGVFDVSHMGEFFVSGPNALALIQKISSNDAAAMSDGQAQYSCMPNENGGIVDDLIIYRFSLDHYMLVVNASNIEKDWAWINAHNTMGAILENRSDDFSLLAVQGPMAQAVVQKLTDTDLNEIKFYRFSTGRIAGQSDVIISNTGYTGSGGFELYCANRQVEAVWNALFEAGAEHGIQPIGLAARDTLRLEMGYCLYGNDIDDTTSPIQAGLGWITKFTKDFVNSAAIAQEKEEGPKVKLCAFELLERGIPRHGYPIVKEDGTEIGRVTSGTMSPSLNKGIGLGYVEVPHNALDQTIYISIRQKQLPAKVVKLPFYKKA
jgi:aminomethyltransferase